MGGDDAWAANDDPRPSTGRAAIRVGDVIVGVRVDHPEGADAAVSLAKRLAGVAAERVRSAGLGQ